MAQILLHGTLHATIYEVDKLQAGGGGNIFSMVLFLILLFWPFWIWCDLIVDFLVLIYLDYEIWNLKCMCFH